MRKYIDANSLLAILVKRSEEAANIEEWHAYAMSCGDVMKMPAADVTEVVRCRDCVMWDGSFTLNGKKKCLNMSFCTDGDFYCGWGSKK